MTKEDWKKAKEQLERPWPYRTVGIADVYANKLAGIYLHSAAEAGT